MNIEKKILCFCIGLCLIIIPSCVRNSVPVVNKVSFEEKNIVKTDEDELIGKEIRLKSDNVYLLDKPGDAGKKIINQQAIDILGEMQYLTVDTSCIVEVIEHQKKWVKVQVVEPDWLRNTHFGWINEKYVEGNTSKLDVPSDAYRIISDENNGNVRNVYIVYLKDDITPEIAKALIDQIRLKINNANINVFSTEAVIPLFKKYPLGKNEYLTVADQYICLSPFDAPLAVEWYPYQDIQYKEYGGKNWKVKPL